MTTRPVDAPVPVPAPDPARTTEAPPPPPYHRLARTQPHYRWWRPLLALVTTAGLWVAALLVLLVGLAVAAAVDPGLGATLDGVMGSAAPLDLHDPIQAALALGGIAVALPAVMLGVRAGGWRFGVVSSVAGRLRWGLLGRCLALALALYLAVQGIGFVLVPSDGPLGLPVVSAQGVGLLCVALLVVPLQAAAEEYVFRGVLMQSIGAWLRHPAWAILLPAPLFVLGHDYSWMGQIDILVFAVAAAWLTWRTGGLEAAIGLHVAGNVLAVTAGAVGLADLNATEIDPWSVAVSVGVTLAYCALVVRNQRWWADVRGAVRR
jgi:uncharacterized protein